MASWRLMRVLTVGWALLNLVDKAASARILFVFPIAFSSHYRAFFPLIEELTTRGHQVTAVTAFETPKPLANFTEILVKPNPHDYKVTDLNFASLRFSNKIKYIIRLWDLLPRITDAIMQTKPMQDLIHSKEKYDIVILESTFGQEYLLAFGHKFNAPLINLHPLYLSPFVAQLAGLPHTFSYIPDFRFPYTDQMSFWQRMNNAIVGVFEIVAGHLYYIPDMDRRMRRIFTYPGSENLPSLESLIEGVSFWMVDCHPLMSYVRPYSPHVIDVAGMNLKKSRTLPPDIQKFMDEAKDGVVYFSFGSFVKSTMITAEQKSVIVNTLKKLKQRVIWKWDEDEPDLPPHILKGSWFPQEAILAHPNCKLFITHGGFNSLMEAMSIGVPVIGIPFFADQSHNVAYYEHVGVGLRSNIDTYTVAELLAKIQTIFNDPSFSENAKRIAKRFSDQPETSLQKAVFWTEYVIRHKGAAHLKPASVTMPYYQYLMLDVIAAVGLSLFFVIYILYLFLRKVVIITGFFSKPKPAVKHKKRE